MGEENQQRPRIGDLNDAKDWLRKKQIEAKPAQTNPPQEELEATTNEEADEVELSEDDLIEDDSLSDIDELEIPISKNN